MITCEFEDGGTGKLRHAVNDAIILKNDKILLIKRTPNLVEGGKWALPGGFITRGENAREATLRELKEETGHTASKSTLFCIVTYPDRTPHEDRQNIVFCYVVEVNPQEGYTHDNEVTDLKWATGEEIESLEIAFDHKKIIKKYLSNRHNTDSFPLIIEKESDY